MAFCIFFNQYNRRGLQEVISVCDIILAKKILLAKIYSRGRQQQIQIIQKRNKMNILPIFPKNLIPDDNAPITFHQTPIFYERQDYWDNMNHTEDMYQEAIQEICRKHNIVFENGGKFDEGTMIVFHINEQYVIKLYSPLFKTDFDIECASLKLLSERIPVPEVIGYGKLEGWPYIIMSKCKGIALPKVWGSISYTEKEQIIEEISKVIIAMHSTPIDERFARFTFDWHDYFSHQAKNAQYQQKLCGLKKPLIDQIPKFLEENLPLIPKTFEKSLLHTELIDGTWILEKNEREWKITGLFDFGDAFVGNREYDIISIGAFVTRGDKKLFRKFLLDYGYKEEELDEKLKRRFMVNIILHKYSNFVFFMKYSGIKYIPETLYDLMEIWFGF